MRHSKSSEFIQTRRLLLKYWNGKISNQEMKYNNKVDIDVVNSQHWCYERLENLIFEEVH